MGQGFHCIRTSSPRAHPHTHIHTHIRTRAVQSGNKYIDVQAPWTLKKTDEERMKTVLYVLAELLRRTAVMLGAWGPSVRSLCPCLTLRCIARLLTPPPCIPHAHARTHAQRP